MIRRRWLNSKAVAVCAAAGLCFATAGRCQGAMIFSITGISSQQDDAQLLRAAVESVSPAAPGTWSNGGTSAAGVAVAGLNRDSFPAANLIADSSTVSVRDYANIARGSDLTSGFLQVGQGNFTRNSQYRYDAGNLQDSFWVTGVLNANTTPTLTNPAPGNLVLAGIGAVGLIGRRLSRRKAAGN